MQLLPMAGGGSTHICDVQPVPLVRCSGQKINILEVLLDPPRLGDHKAHPEMHVGPDVNPQNIEGATPLHKACYWGRTEFINLLLNREADPTLKNALGRTPLHECAQNGHVDAATALITFNPNLMQSTPVDTKKKPAKKGKKDDSAEIEVCGVPGRPALHCVTRILTTLPPPSRICVQPRPSASAPSSSRTSA